jgi:hypothetical protein
MKIKPKTIRDMPSRPTKSAIPRTEGSMFLMLNRLSTERERLLQDEADLLARLEQKRQRMARLEAEMEYYKAQIELFQAPPAPRPQPAPRRAAQAANPVSFEVEAEEPTQWQSLVVEY